MDNKAQSRINELIRKHKRNRVMYVSLVLACIVLGSGFYYYFSNSGYAYEGEMGPSIETSTEGYASAETPVSPPEISNEGTGVPREQEEVSEPVIIETPEEVIIEAAEETLAEGMEEIVEEIIEETVEEAVEEAIEETVEEVDEPEENTETPDETVPVAVVNNAVISIRYDAGTYNAEKKTMSYMLTIEAAEDTQNAVIENRVELNSEYSIPGNGPEIASLVVNYNSTRNNLISDMQINGNVFQVFCPSINSGDIIVISFEVDLSNVFGAQIVIENTCHIMSDDLYETDTNEFRIDYMV
jgi:hypothetical protein